MTEAATERALGTVGGEAVSDDSAASHASALLGPQRSDSAPSLSLATCLLIALWIAVEAAGLAGLFWAFDQAEIGGQGAHAGAMALYLAAVPAALALVLVWLLCGPRERRGQWSAGAIAAFAVSAWAGLDQLGAAGPRQPVSLFFQRDWQVQVAVTPAPMLLVWWLWGVAVVVFFYRYFGRGRITREATAEELPLRSSQLLVITLLVSVTAAGARFWGQMLPIAWPDVVLMTGLMFGFGVCSGLCFLSLTIGLLQSWWGYLGLLLAVLATAGYAANVGVFFGDTVTAEWVAALLAALAAVLFHGAVFLLPLRAAGYRLRGVR